MKNGKIVAFLSLIIAALSMTAMRPVPSPSPNGIMLPDGYRDWKLIAASYRRDNNTLRAILGNDTAVKAARAGKVNPWPDGSILAKIVWKTTAHEKWKTAVIPDAFVHAEFMIKDREKFASTGGWGFARWKGLDLKPYGKGPEFSQECYGCHLPVKDRDYVFTRPAVIP